jgi:hypothetical protein
MTPTPDDRIEAMALALQRLRNASSALLKALDQGDTLGAFVSEVEASLWCAALSEAELLRWADDMLRARILRRPKASRKHITLTQLLTRARTSGVTVSKVYDFGKQVYVVYRGSERLAKANTDAALSGVLARILGVDRRRKDAFNDPPIRRR